MNTRSRSIAVTLGFGIAGCGGPRATESTTTSSSAAPIEPAKPATAAPQIEPLDLVVVIDVSKSMEETDVAPDRLEASKTAIRRFIADGTKHDQVGLVIYGLRATLRAPLTSDSEALDDSVAGLAMGDIPDFGTAMGDGLALAVDQLRTSTAKRKAVILLADGDYNVVNQYDPDQASALAKTLGVVVYTILVGTEPGPGVSAVSTDPKMLTSIASTTGGTFYRAIDQDSFGRALQDVRAKLDAARAVKP